MHCQSQNTIFEGTAYWNNNNRVVSKSINLFAKISSVKIFSMAKVMNQCPLQREKSVESEKMIYQIQKLFGCHTSNYRIKDENIAMDIVSGYDQNPAYKEALKYYGKALELIEKHLEGGARITKLDDLLYLKSRALIRLGLHNKAVTMLQSHFQTDVLLLEIQKGRAREIFEEAKKILQTDRIDNKEDKKPELKSEEGTELSLCQSITMHYGQAKIFVAQEKYIEALNYLNIALENAFKSQNNIWLSPTLINEMLCDKACIHQYLGHHSALLQCIELIQSRPAFRILDGEYGIFWATMNNWDWTSAFQNDGNEMRFLVARTYNELGNYKAALHHLDKCFNLEHQPHDFSENMSLVIKGTHSTVFEEKVSNLDATQQLKKLSTFEAEARFMSVEWWFNKSFTFFCADLTEKAMRCVDDGIKLSPDSPHLLFVKAVVLLSHAKLAAADLLFDQLLKMSKTDTHEHTMSLLGKGLVLAVDNIEQAQVYFQQAEKAIMKHMLREQLNFYYIKGKILTTLGLNELANSAYDAALVLKPDYVPVLQCVKTLSGLTAVPLCRM